MARKNKTRTPRNNAPVGKARTIARRVVQISERRAVVAPPDLSRSNSLLSALRNKTAKATSLRSNHATNRALSPVASQRLPVYSPRPLVAARREQHRILALPKQEIRTEAHRIQSKLHLAPASITSPDRSSLKAREDFRCKKRPDSKKASSVRAGSGVSKAFVPWC